MLRRAFLPAVLLLPALSAADLTGLSDRLNSLMSESAATARATIGIHVVDVATGETLFDTNSTRLFLPASNLKLFTAALALHKLGPNYRYETRLVREASGDVVLLGSGDPSFSGAVYPYTREDPRGNPLQPVEDLADQAVAAGLREVRGNIIGDDQLYPWSPFPASWTADDLIYSYGAPVSALSLGENAIRITVRPGAAANDLARINLIPALEYFAIDNRVRTIDGAGANVQLVRVPGSRQLLLDGTIGLRRASYSEAVAIDDPALFAATALYDALQRRGVNVHGRPVARHRSQAGARFAPKTATDAKVLATRTSPPLTQILERAIKISENLHLELLLREVGRASGGDATIANGLRQMSVMLSSAGVPNTEWRAEDGSGLARNDQVTPHAVTHLLTYMALSENRDAWLAMLPVGGQDGTLARRLCCTADSTLIRAKTGSLARSVALSGYADSKSRGRLAFSILVNNFAASDSEVRAWVDKIALALIE